jgi:hypothetical protein
LASDKSPLVDDKLMIPNPQFNGKVPLVKAEVKVVEVGLKQF